MSDGRVSHRALGLALGLVAGAAVLALPWWAGQDAPGAPRMVERVDQLERDLRRLSTVVGDLDVRVTHVESDQVSTRTWLETALPRSARWIVLRAGEGEQWDLGAGGRAQVQFLKLDDQGLPILRVHNRAVEISASLGPGMALRAVDDLGDKQRYYVTSLHRLAVDRDGRASRALISQTVETE